MHSGQKPLFARTYHPASAPAVYWITSTGKLCAGTIKVNISLRRKNTSRPVGVGQEVLFVTAILIDKK